MLVFRLCLLLSGLACWLLPALALADEAAETTSGDTESVPTITLTIVPATEPRPALKYRLLPALSERKPGNGATHYYRAIILQRQLPKEFWQEASDNYTAWNEAPRDEYPETEVAKWLERQQNVLAEVRQAAYKDNCDWGFRLQDLHGSQLYTMLIPEIQECRELARTLRVKARYEIFTGKPDDAIETLRWGYQLARDAAQPPFLVSALVGVAVTGIMNAELEHLISESRENYYWAIAGLPEPVVNLHPALEFEMQSPFQVFPFLRDAETAARSPDEWRRLILESMRQLVELGGPKDFGGWQGELAAVALMTKLYPAAKQELIAAGMDRDKIEAMPTAQVVAIQTARITEAAYHDIFKLSLLPYDEAIQRLPKMLKQLEKDVIRPAGTLPGKAGLPIASVFLPAVDAVLRAEVRMTRNMAVLEAIEAIRLHAAATGGHLPKSLAEVTIVPVPNNPATGQPFPYQLAASGESATLEVPTLAGYLPRHDGKRYVLRLKK